MSNDIRQLLALLCFFILMPAVSAETRTAKAFIAPTNPVDSMTGWTNLEETPEGLKVTVGVVEAPPGRHGIHIHEKGDCGDRGNAAGGHFNPDAVPHGDLLKDGFEHAHAGDLGNIEIGSNGNGKLEKILPGLTMTEGKYAVIGRTIILHEKEDDFGQPTGNSGGRIACGIIETQGNGPASMIPGAVEGLI